MADVSTMPASTSTPFSHAAGQHPIPSVTKTQSSKDSDISRSTSTRSAPRRAPDDSMKRKSVASSSFALSRAGSKASRTSRLTTTQPLFSSSLDYTSVRDFAYKREEPAHYGIALPSSGATTPASEYYGNGRRLSDPIEALFRGGASGRVGNFTAGAWGGDGVLWGEPSGGASGSGEPEWNVEPLPSTSFAGGGEWSAGHLGEDDAPSRKGKHRKSRSYADISDFERERSGGSTAVATARRRSHRRSREQYDPAGRENLRLSRGFADAGSDRRDSHFARMNGGGSGLAAPGGGVILPNAQHPSRDPDTRMPLDEEYNEHTYHHEGQHADAKSGHAQQRDSLSPEDESVRGLALALYDFEPENPNELHLTEGQIVNVAYRNGHGWLVAEDPVSGEQGLVPEAYVRLVRDIEGWDEEKGGFFEEDEDDEGMSEDASEELDQRDDPSSKSDPKGAPDASHDEDEGKRRQTDDLIKES